MHKQVSFGFSMALSACAGAAADSAGSLYWMEQVNFSTTALKSMSLDGGGADTVFEVGPPTFLPWDVAVDPAVGRVWWMHSTASGMVIRSTAMDGSDDQQGPEMQQSIGFALDRQHRRLYWGDRLGGCCGNGEIYMMAYDGSDFVTVSADGGDVFPFSTTVRPDPQNNTVYFGRGHQLFRAQFDGANPAPVAVTSAFTIALDPENRHIYLAEGSTGSISRMDYSGRNLTPILRGAFPINEANDLTVDPVNDRLYWITGHFGGVIRSATLTGQDVVTVYTPPRGVRISGIDVLSAPASVIGDLNVDGVVDGIDLGILLAQWGTGGSADLNGDRAVDGVDLGILLANWTL